MNKWDKLHGHNITLYQKRVKAEYAKAIEAIVKNLGLLPLNLGNKALSLSDYPIIEKNIDTVLNDLKNGIYNKTTNGIREEWALSQQKNDAVLSRLYHTEASKQLREIRTTDALDAFINRKTNGLTLSDRVWHYSNMYKSEIESGLDICIRDGLSASQTASRLKQYLVYPDKLFRRVRDTHGVLQLSKNAKAFHPGQGVYRSSYKNARRLVATETNMAYRLSDYQRWQDETQVVGIEIKLSNNHTINGVPFSDICDDLKGKYPKDFVFTGWHPLCRCYAIPIIKTDEELIDDLKRIGDGKSPSSSSVNKVSNPPAGFTKWIADNRDRLSNMRSLPYFVANNERFIQQLHITRSAANKAVEANKMVEAVTKKPSALKVAETRHNARTPEQIQAIKGAWEIRFKPVDYKLLLTERYTERDDLVQQAQKLLKITGYKLPIAPESISTPTLQRVVIDMQNEFKKEVVQITLYQNRASKIMYNLPDSLPATLRAKFIQFQKAYDNLPVESFYDRKNALNGIINLKELIDKNVDFNKVSMMMPAELLPNGKFITSNTYLRKDFFDNLVSFIPVKKGGQSAYYQHQKMVEININDTRRTIEGYQSRVLYHEYGHAMDYQNVFNRTEISALMDKWNAQFLKKDELGILLYDDIEDSLESTFKALGGFTGDERDIIYATMDVVQSLSKGKYGCISIDGHSVRYWKGNGNSIAEFIAHISEFANMGNEQARIILGELYDEMVQLGKKYLRYK